MAIRGKKAGAPAVFELRSASTTLVVVALKTTDMAAIERALDERFAATPEMFSHDPVVIDVAQAAGDPAALDFGRLIELLRRHRMLAAAVRGASAEQLVAADAAGLGGFEGAVPEGQGGDAAGSLDTSGSSIPQGERGSFDTSGPSIPQDGRMSFDTSGRAGLEDDAQDPPAPPPVHPEVSKDPHVPTLIVDRPLRSGQQVYARGGDLVVLAPVNVGAEVIADGSIHVYAPLRGKAVAGAKGDVTARIFSTCMEPELIAIAGTYRTTDTPLPADVAGKPAQIRLDGERLVFEPLA